MNIMNIESIKMDRTAMPSITKVNNVWTWNDLIGSAMVRAGFGRDSYKVEPGLYALGEPDSDSDILVTANYKLTFDIVRRSLSELDVWLLVLDTKGINVWCAAGKGTFGTDELIRRIDATKLSQVVKHQRLILPQLGAVGVAAHKVKERTGFRVAYGPVRIADAKAFIEDGYKASETMRTVHFPFKERVKLTPVEFSMSFKYLIIGCMLLSILAGINNSGYSLTKLANEYLHIIALSTAAYLAGTLVAPSLLPWLPFKSFSLKGALTGLVVWLAFAAAWPFAGVFNAFSWLLLFVAVSSFLAMNFTGASTYTSLSGVKKEMKYAIPAQITLAIVGLGIFVVAQIL
jgi:hypothetical protein